MLIIYFFVQYMQFPVLDFGLDHYSSFIKVPLTTESNFIHSLPRSVSPLPCTGAWW